MTYLTRLTSLGKALAVFFVCLAFAAVVMLVSAHSSSREPAQLSGSGGMPGEANDVDNSGAPMRVAIVVFTPSRGSSPRIIHVPQGGERDNEASAGGSDEAVATIGNDEADVATPPPRYRVIPLPRNSEAHASKHHVTAPAPQRHNETASIPRHGDAPILQKLNVTPKQQGNAQPAPQPQSAVAPAEPIAAAAPPSQPRIDVPPPQLGVNPPAAPAASEADAKLTPVRPTPRYGNKIEQDKSGSYGPSISAHAPPPPIGYTPPSGLPYRSN